MPMSSIPICAYKAFTFQYQIKYEFSFHLLKLHAFDNLSFQQSKIFLGNRTKKKKVSKP